MPKNEILKAKNFYFYKNKDEEMLEIIESDGEFQATVRFLLEKYIELRKKSGKNIHDFLSGGKKNMKLQINKEL